MSDLAESFEEAKRSPEIRLVGKDREVFLRLLGMFVSPDDAREVGERLIFRANQLELRRNNSGEVVLSNEELLAFVGAIFDAVRDYGLGD